MMNFKDNAVFDMYGIKTSFPEESAFLFDFHPTAMAQQLFNYAEFDPSVHQSKTFGDGSRFVGEMKDGQASGRGIRLFLNGDLYIGNFKKNLLDGHGWYYCASGWLFVSNFVMDAPSLAPSHIRNAFILYADGHKDQMHKIFDYFPRNHALFQYHLGRGDKPTVPLSEITIGQTLKTVEYISWSGNHYIGEINEIGQNHGKGKQEWDKVGTCYEGQWKNGLMHGFGKKSFSTGSYYEGEFVEDVYCGYGKYYSYKGWHSEGEYQHNKLNGKGKYYFASGSVYEGDFIRDMFHGQGRMVYDCGDVYEGRWENDKQNGEGTYTWASGDVYIGSWSAGMRHGRGVYKAHNGWGFEGEYHYGKMCGQGQYNYANGDVYVGGWKDDKLDGQGKMTYANGDWYEGGFKQDKRHGYGVFESVEKNEREEGFYDMGFKHGLFKVLYHPNGLVRLHLYYKGNMIDSILNYRSAIDVKVYQKINFNADSELMEFIPFSKTESVSDFARDFALFVARSNKPEDCAVPPEERDMDKALSTLDTFVERLAKARQAVVDGESGKTESQELCAKFITVFLGCVDMQVKPKMKMCEGDIWQWTTEMLLFLSPNWVVNPPSRKAFAALLMWALYCDTFGKNRGKELFWFAHFNSYGRATDNLNPQYVRFLDEGQALTVLYCLRLCYGDPFRSCQESPTWTDSDYIARFMEKRYGDRLADYKSPNQLVLHANGYLFDKEKGEYLGLDSAKS